MTAPGPARERETLIHRMLSRLERSQNVFLAGLVVAFAIEIVVDWNTTFYEINVLRDAMREKAVHYAALLRIAAEDPLAAADGPRLQNLARRIRADEEVVFVRITDAHLRVLVDEGAGPPSRSPHQMERDLAGALRDPDELRAKVASSRHRDVYQIITDAEDRLVRALGGPPPKPPRVEQSVVYQDRLYDERTRSEKNRSDDRTIVWSLVRIEDHAGVPLGVAMIALDTARLRSGIAKKLWKGSAVTVFFLGVILVQQLGSRRAKMRLLSMSDALAAARSTLSAALPSGPPSSPDLDGALAFEQAERLGGTVYDFHAAPSAKSGSGRFDVFVALPEGSGVDVAFASLLVRDQHRRLRDTLPDPSPEPLLGALAQAYGSEPIHRRLELALFRVDPENHRVYGVVCGVAPPTILDENGHPIAAEVEAITVAGAVAALIEPPIRRFAIAFPPRATLLFYSDGLPEAGPHPVPVAEVLRRAGERRFGPAADLVADLRGLAMKRTAKQLSDDLFVLALRRTA